jgi:uncharacterized SAM-binding protein YcdF (DUF218 family)
MPRHVTERWRDFLGPGAVPSLLAALVIAVVGLGIPVLVRLKQVLGRARQDERGPADAILVVGRVLQRNGVGDIFAARLAHSAQLYAAGLAPHIIVAGGLTGDATRTEAAAGREHLLTLGIPAAAIVCEDSSRHTLENLVHVRETVRARGWRKLLAVSDPLHIARVRDVALGLGLEVRCSPAPGALPAGWRYYLRALREAQLLHWYHSGVSYSRWTGNQRYLARVT